MFSELQFAVGAESRADVLERLRTRFAAHAGEQGVDVLRSVPEFLGSALDVLDALLRLRARRVVLLRFGHLMFSAAWAPAVEPFAADGLDRPSRHIPAQPATGREPVLSSTLAGP